MGSSAMKRTRRAGEFHAYKLFPPQPYPDAIRRDAILHRVFESDGVRVVFLQAPAGHGKSTSLHQVKAACEAKGVLTAWLTFDEADNDTRRFLIHFQAILAAARGGAEPRQPLADDDADDAIHHRQRSDWVIDRLLAFNQPVALFFDDFQVLENRAILGFFRELLERVPENARIFIGSRSTPEIGLSRLVVSRQALILRPEELRFSPAEVEQFFAATGSGISREEVEGIYRRTEGWPAALQLYRLSMVNPAVRRSLGDFSASRPRELAEYLADNVLALQEPGIRDFLRRTSLLTRLTAPLCNKVTGRSDSQDILLSLERSGLFVRSLDAHFRWFEYHALFASFLSEQLLNRSEATAMEVHRIAAKWHLQHDNFEDSVHHAVACGDFSMAADTLDLWGGRLISGAHLITMERWYDRIPFKEIASRRSLLIKSAWALVFLRRREKLKPVLAALRQCDPPFDLSQSTNPDIVQAMVAVASDEAGPAFEIVERVPLRSVDVDGFAAFEVSAAANLLGFRQLAYGDFEGARQYLSLARVYGDRADATFSHGYTIGVTGVGLLLEGHLREALERLKAGMAEQRMQVDRSYASAALACCYIWGLYEANQLDAAEALFGQYHDVIADSALLDFLAVAQISMARIHDVRGRPAKAVAALDEAEAIGHASDSRRYLRLLRWERIRRALLLGDVDRAQAIAMIDANHSPPEPQPWLLFSEDLEGESLGQIRLAIHRDELDRAAELLDQETLRQRGRIFRQIKLYLLDAQLQHRKGSRNIAQRSLRRALQLAAPGGYVRCFLDEGEPVLSLLHSEYDSLVDSAGREVQHGTDRQFVELLLQASGADLGRTGGQTAARTLEPLTDKEMRILAFLENGVTNKEMGERLFISENTVKFHLKNIYSKLSVASRLQAIAAARELGLVK